MNSINWPASSIWAFIVQLGEHCSANAEATGSNPIEAPKNFFQATLQLLKLQFTAMVTYSFYLLSLLPIKAASCLYSDTFLRYQGSVVWERKPCECSMFGASGSTNSFLCTFKRANLCNVRRKQESCFLPKSERKTDRKKTLASRERPAQKER